MKNKQPTLPSDTTQLPYDKQLEMLNQCASAQADVQTVLAQIGLSLDSLNYRNTPLLPDLSKVDYQYIDDIEIPSTTIPAISFFSGAGGMDIGFKYAGFDNQASVEFNEIFCNTLRLNNPDKLVIGPPAYSGDVRNFSEIVNALNSKLSIKAPFEGIFHGGPPCQSFSMAANQRFAKGASASLILSMVTCCSIMFASSPRSGPGSSSLKMCLALSKWTEGSNLRWL
jgi:DNA (cytosine-5)-methyltransferase 1